MKRCYVCDVEKAPTEFNRNSSRYDGLQAKCRECAREYQRQRPKRDYAAYKRLRTYGLTPERYAEFLREQAETCAICRAGTPGGKGGWHVDHDHATGEVRGLLCHYCNLMLGMARDNADVLTAAIAYLASPPASRVPKEDAA